MPASGVPDIHTILGTSKKPTVSGIVEQSLTGNRVVPESRRADGSIRKERKIRPGYTPPEEIEKFKSARQLDQERNARPKGVVPGMAANALLAAQAGAAASRSAKKNQKRKEKRDEEDEGSTPSSQSVPASATPDEWDAEEEEEPAAKPAPPPEEPKEVDPEKRAKALNKKLRQAESLRDRQGAGETLLPEQQEKVDGIAALEAELAKLTV